MREWVKLYLEHNPTSIPTLIAAGFVVNRGSGVFGDKLSSLNIYSGLDIDSQDEGEWIDLQVQSGRVQSYLLSVNNYRAINDHYSELDGEQFISLSVTSPVSIPNIWLSSYILNTRGLWRDVEYLNAIRESISVTDWRGWYGTEGNNDVYEKWPDRFIDEWEDRFPLFTMDDFFGQNGVFKEYGIRVWMQQEKGESVIHYSYPNLAGSKRNWVQSHTGPVKIEGLTSRSMTIDTHPLVTCYDILLQVIRERNEASHQAQLTRNAS